MVDDCHDFSACAILNSVSFLVFPSPKSPSKETERATYGSGLETPLNTVLKTLAVLEGCWLARDIEHWTLRPHLVSVRGELRLDLVVDLGALLGLGQRTAGGLLALVVSSTLDLSALLESA